MQIKIKIHLDRPLTLPLSYHHILQAILYKLMGDSDGFSELHDGGKQYGKRKYKMFTFSLLEGKCGIRNKEITFFNSVGFEVRSIDEDLIRKIEDNVLKDGINIFNTVYTNIECTLKNEHITKDSILINMISPVCVYKTVEASGNSNYTNYLNPSCPDFSEEINNNFVRKYTAAEQYAGEKISIEPVLVTPKDKYITTYKGVIIEAYRGVYVLSGKVEYLDFLYNVGIGSKNSQGFGMFNLFKNTQ